MPRDAEAIIQEGGKTTRNQGSVCLLENRSAISPAMFTNLVSFFMNDSFA